MSSLENKICFQKQESFREPEEIEKDIRHKEFGVQLKFVEFMFKQEDMDMEKLITKHTTLGGLFDITEIF